jgi:hypothetical protein
MGLCLESVFLKIYYRCEPFELRNSIMTLKLAQYDK